MSSRRRARDRAPRNAPVRLYGRHTVLAALANPHRLPLKLHATPDALAALGPLPHTIPVQSGHAADLARLVPADAPHQGLVLEVEPLETAHLDDLLADAHPLHPLVVLDQVTDPQNVGAIIRSAAAFGARGLVTQDRHSPPETGALARAASGTLEILPWARVVNLARALEAMAEAGLWRIGLAGEAKATLAEALVSGPVALVLGAEGEGLRPNVAAHCDTLARLPIAPAVESLNVSTATAVALYATVTR
ncbi:MAG: 23S rRNA (guanosine(2251)-2'-O)-methyltransferase RlmB [Thermaurantiacus sp.]